jgi:hypothetical protein
MACHQISLPVLSSLLLNLVDESLLNLDNQFLVFLKVFRAELLFKVVDHYTLQFQDKCHSSHLNKFHQLPLLVVNQE